jgi:hypothetical protein
METEKLKKLALKSVSEIIDEIANDGGKKRGKTLAAEVDSDCDDLVEEPLDIPEPTQLVWKSSNCTNVEGLVG